MTDESSPSDGPELATDDLLRRVINAARGTGMHVHKRKAAPYQRDLEQATGELLERITGKKPTKKAVKEMTGW